MNTLILLKDEKLESVAGGVLYVATEISVTNSLESAGDSDSGSVSLVSTSDTSDGGGLDKSASYDEGIEAVSGYGDTIQVTEFITRSVYTS